jgi:quinol monooxygenase YgiN
MKHPRAAAVAQIGNRDSVGGRCEVLPMVGGLKIIQVRAGCEAEFERLFRALAAETHERERGCVVYTLMRSRKQAGAYVVHEQYADQNALGTHQISVHVTRYAPRLRELLQAYQEEYFDVLAG